MNEYQFDPSLVETIIGQVKSQGVFDEFRRECLSDVDTKPAYQNLRQRVETTVSKFLSKQEWKPNMNRNQVREKMRRYIVEMNFLDAGVERIVDQVVDPKKSTVFMPKIEEMVYSYLGIEKPVTKREEPAIDKGAADVAALSAASVANGCDNDGLTVETNLLPTDLEAVSPDSEKSGDCKLEEDFVNEEEVTEEVVTELNESDKMDDEESPAFEPLEITSNVQVETDKTVSSANEDTQDSEISGLTSQESVESIADRSHSEHKSPPVAQSIPEQSNISQDSDKPSKMAEPEGTIKEDSQLSQVSSDTQISMVSSQKSPHIKEELKMDISEEAQMPTEFSDSKDSSSKALTNFDISKDELIFDRAIDMEKDTASQASVKIESTTIGMDEPELVGQASCESTEVKVEKLSSPDENKPNLSSKVEANKILVNTSALTEETSESLLDSGDSMDLKIVESDSRSSATNQSSVYMKESSKSSEKRQPSEKSRSSSSHHHHKSSHRHKSSSSSHKSSRDKDKHRSSHHRSSSDNKKRSRSKSRKDGEKKVSSKTDDHSSHRSDKAEKRRSTDRDSNDGTGGGNTAGRNGSSDKYKSTKASSSKTTSTCSSSSPKENNNPPGNQHGCSTAIETATITSTTSTPRSEKVADPKDSSTGLAPERQQKPVVVDQILSGMELNLQMMSSGECELNRDPALVASLIQMTDIVTRKKPKIAANIKEARQMSKIRKKMDLERVKELEKAAVIYKELCAKQRTPATSPIESDPEEDDLLYFPEAKKAKYDSSVTDRWWNSVKAENEDVDMVDSIAKELDDRMNEMMKRPSPMPKKTQETKPKNGLTKSISISPSNNTPLETAIDDPDDYYQEAVVDFEDLSQDMPENNNFQKENKNYGLILNKLGPLNGDSELELISGSAVDSSGSGEEKRSRPTKPPIAQTQRYTSEDLYKPRPIIQRTRRSRVLSEPEKSH